MIIHTFRSLTFETCALALFLSWYQIKNCWTVFWCRSNNVWLTLLLSIPKMTYLNISVCGLKCFRYSIIHKFSLFSSISCVHYEMMEICKIMVLVLKGSTTHWEKIYHVPTNTIWPDETERNQIKSHYHHYTQKRLCSAEVAKKSIESSLGKNCCTFLAFHICIKHDNNLLYFLIYMWGTFRSSQQ